MSKFGQELNKHYKTNLKEEIKNLLDEESYSDFNKALENKLVPASSIVVALKSFGIEVSDNTIRRWRNGQ
jgi:hypothetical protein